MTGSAGRGRQPVRRVPFHVPSIDEGEIAEVVETLRSGWLTTGPRVRRFEDEFAQVVGARHAVAVNSGTAALHLALEAVGVRAGDEVIVPTYTFTATAEVVTYLGARPVLADCRADTLNIDITTVEPLVTPRTRAIVPVHIAGQACDMAPIFDLARARDISVVEDAAHALPTTYRGRPIGGLAAATVFSFYATKSITTGEGGMLTTDSGEYATRMRQMSVHGLSHDAWKRYTGTGHWYYDVVEFGFKYNMTDIAAALGLRQLQRLADFHKQRQRIAQAYNHAFAGMDSCTPPHEAAYGTHAWHLYVLQLEPESLHGGRDAVVDELRRRGVETSVHFIPLHLQRAYQKAFGYSPGQFPTAEAAFQRVVSLPLYPRMDDDDVGAVIDAVRATLRALRR